MADNTTSQILDSKPSAQVQQLDMIKLYYGATTDKNTKNKQDLGIEIEQDSISEIYLTESIFGTLPKLRIKLFDNGEWATTFAFRAGTNIRLIITPRNGNDDMIMAPILDCFFTLEGINYVMDQNASKYIYELNCIYSCESFINKVCTWPETDILQAAKSAATNAIGLTKNDNPYKKTSKEVLEQLIGQTSLKFAYLPSKDPTDKMLWLNKTLSYAKFAKHIIDHAWLSEKDLPLLYINRNGQCFYDSLSRMTSQGIRGSYVFSTRYVNMKQKNLNENKNDVVVKPYQDLSFVNIPFKAFNDGCAVQVSQYNPYNKDYIDKEKQKAQKVADEEEISYRQIEFNGNGPYLASVSNKSIKSVNLVNTRQYTGMYFKELHEYYNVAPLHHKNIRNSFFTNFCYMVLDMNEQFDTKENDPQAKKEDKENKKSYINLGDKINIDVSDTKYKNRILSGDFIVSGLTHIWAPNTSYTIVVQGVNDGTNETGYMDLYNDMDKASNDSKKSR